VGIKEITGRRTGEKSSIIGRREKHPITKRKVLYLRKEGGPVPSAKRRGPLLSKPRGARGY